MFGESVQKDKEDDVAARNKRAEEDGILVMERDCRAVRRLEGNRRGEAIERRLLWKLLLVELARKTVLLLTVVRDAIIF